MAKQEMTIRKKMGKCLILTFKMSRIGFLCICGIYFTSFLFWLHIYELFWLLLNRLRSVPLILGYYQRSAIMGSVFHIKIVTFISVALISAETLIPHIIKRRSFFPFSLGELINVFSPASSCNYVEALWPLLAGKQHNTRAVTAATLQSSSSLILGYKVSLHVWDETGNWTDNNEMIIKVLQGWEQQQRPPVQLWPPTPGTNLPFISRDWQHWHRNEHTHTQTQTHTHKLTLHMCEPQTAMGDAAQSAAAGVLYKYSCSRNNFWAKAVRT